MTHELMLPWPPRALSPNARTHWAAKAKAAKTYRMQCAAMTRAFFAGQDGGALALQSAVSNGATIHLFIDFIPPDWRARDDDNLVAAFKAGRDGIAQAMGIDDRNFRQHPFLRDDEVIKGGQVRVRVTCLSEDGEACGQ